MLRFAPENYARNLKLLESFTGISRDVGCTPAQLALAWLLSRGDDVIPIPGTTRVEHLLENMLTLGVHPSLEVLDRVDRTINQRTVVGARYNSAAQADVDTEEF